MPPKNKGEGTKIAQAAKDLNVTSVTIRRYIAEFNIPTTSDENGIKVLPSEAMEELHLIRQLKEDGLTNPKVLEHLEEHRKNPSKGGKADKKTETKRSSRAAAEKVVEEKPEKEPAKKRATTRGARRVKDEAPEVEEQQELPAAAPPPPAEADSDSEGAAEETKEGEADGGDGQSKHSLTCQTCSKVFEHMNPRLRDCLECYRAKRKERRRGGDKHKNVIQHPLAQQVLNKAQQAQKESQAAAEEAPPAAEPRARAPREPRESREQPVQAVRTASTISAQPSRHQVRNYRKAIEETRTITANLKRRLERPDLPESERRWLEQIYAYQLILHQGWRHLSEYKAGNTTGTSQKEKE
jgi:DNA-binding transcriptional MerR regulator